MQKKKPKLALVIPTLRGAGCERLITDLLPHLNNQFQLHLILYHPDIVFPVPSDIAIKLIRSDTGATTNYLYKLYRFLKRIYTLTLLFKSNDYQVIFSLIDLNNVVVYFAQLLAKQKAKLVMSERTINDAFFTYNRYARRLKHIIRFLLRFAYNRADVVIVNSRTMRDYLRERLNVRRPIEVIYNGINTKKFHPLRSRIDMDIETLEKIYVDRHIIRILNVGRLDDNKDQQFLISIFPEILRIFPAARLFIIGTGPNWEVLGDYIKYLKLENNVYLLGWKSNIEDYFRLADIFLLSSYHESFGNVLLEAMACGVPVITSHSTNALYEILDNGRLGMIVSKQNRVAYIDAVVQTLKRRSGNRKFRQSLSDHVKLNFNLDNVKAQYIEVLKNTIN